MLLREELQIEFENMWPFGFQSHRVNYLVNTNMTAR